MTVQLTIDEYIEKLKTSKNIILRGAPGTGKSYLAKQIAAKMIGTEMSKLPIIDQFSFVQFHPNYDYTDFVEGLKPVSDENNDITFKLLPGVFQKFCYEADQCYTFGRLMEDVKLQLEEEKIRKKLKPYWDDFLRKFDDKDNELQINDNLTVKLEGIDAVFFESMFEEHDLETLVQKIQQHAIKIENKYTTQTGGSYYKDIHNLLKYILPLKLPNYILVIDEINRGDIANIFGELFYAIDPSYRGRKGAIRTQYHSVRGKNSYIEGFFDELYVPDNVYIIGTMNDIDRSVETFDFAMRRRFRFIEVTADSQIYMIQDHPHFEEAEKEKAINTMCTLNRAIADVDEFNHNYHVGPAYFLTLIHIDYRYDILWEDYIQPLISEYVRGLPDAEDIIETIYGVYVDGNKS